jgi:hypothetical protein
MRSIGERMCPRSRLGGCGGCRRRPIRTSPGGMLPRTGVRRREAMHIPYPAVPPWASPSIHRGSQGVEKGPSHTRYRSASIAEEEARLRGTSPVASLTCAQSVLAPRCRQYPPTGGQEAMARGRSCLACHVTPCIALQGGRLPGGDTRHPYDAHAPGVCHHCCRRIPRDHARTRAQGATVFTACDNPTRLS